MRPRWRWRCGWPRTSFSPCSVAPPLALASAPLGRTLFPLTVFATAYFFLNTGLVAGAVAIGRDTSFHQVWREHFFPLWLTHFGGTSIAALLLALMASGVADVRTLTAGLPLIVALGLLLTGTDRLRQRSARFAELRSYAAALRSTADGVLLTNVDDRITFLNPKAERLTGWTDAAARDGTPATYFGWRRSPPVIRRTRPRTRCRRTA